MLYRIRPSIGGATHVAFLEEVYEARAKLVEPVVKNAGAIVRANTYFGQYLRDAGVSDDELSALLKGGDVIAFAERIDVALHQACSILHDIKYGEGKFVGPKKLKWQPTLLDFKKIVPPKWGSAAGKTTLGQWRAYAGASRLAAKPEAERRADMRRRPRVQKPSYGGKRSWQQSIHDDDWFDWTELCKSEGWEVRVGPAFADDANFEAYLATFIALHDARKENDWAAYHRLLTDYVGVGADGRIPSRRETRNCLRAVMLGYLKTHEVVDGGNCQSCSRCVPSEKFDASIDARRRVVVRLAPQLEELIAQLESFHTASPPPNLVLQLIRMVYEEADRGRSVREYVAGWSSRLLQDAPNHHAALRFRIEGMIGGLFELQPEEMVVGIRHLAELAPDEALADLQALVGRAQEHCPKHPDLWRASASVSRRMDDFRSERQALDALIRLLRGTGSPDLPILIGALERLVELSAADGPLPDDEMHREALLALARLASTSDTAARAYSALVENFDTDDVASELRRSLVDSSKPVCMACGLLRAWIDTGDPAAGRNTQAASLLALVGPAVIDTASKTDRLVLIESIDPAALAAFPDIATSLLRGALQLQRPLRQMSLERCIRLAADLTAGEEADSEAIVDLLIDKLFLRDIDRLSLSKAARLLTGDAGLSDVVGEWDGLLSKIAIKSAPQFRPADGPEWLAWFDVFPPRILRDPDSDLALWALRAVPANLGHSIQAARESTRLETVMEAILDRLLCDQVDAPVHIAFADKCPYLPVRLVARYIDRCLRAPLPRWKRAEECAHRYMDDGPELAEFISFLRQTPLPGRSPRIAGTIEFDDLLKEHDQGKRILAGRLTLETYKVLWQVLNPALNPQRANMTVAAVRYLRAKHRPSEYWLTPVEKEVQALCLAHRLDEARIVGRKHVGLTIGPRREAADDFIDRHDRGHGGGKDPYESDYARILQLV